MPEIRLWLAPMYLLWGLWVLQAVLCAIQAKKFRGKLDRGDRQKFHDFTPPAVIVVPFKDIDSAGVANIHALFRQDYPDYRVIAVVESEDDPALPVLQRELAAAQNGSTRGDIVVAGLSGPHQGQKVHNQLAALDHLERFRPHNQPRHPDEVWVFADSDAVPNRAWLGRLIGPLQKRESNAVTTGYRWFVPGRGSRARFPLGAQVASCINAGVATFMAYDRFAFAWGGSMALRAETAERGGLRERWAGALSDDYQMTALARGLGMRVYFIPACLVESPLTFDLPAFLEFARRQYVITRVHAPRLFRQAFAVVALYVVAWLAAAAALALGALQRDPHLWAPAAAAGLLVFALNQLRHHQRRHAIKSLFRSGTLQRLSPALRLDRWATPLVFTLNLMAFLSAAFQRRITWRGRTYLMRGPQRVEELRHP